MMIKRINFGVVGGLGPFGDASTGPAPTRWLATSGYPGYDTEGRLSSSFEVQAEWSWRHVVRALEAADMTVHDIVRVTHYLVRREDLALYRPIRDRFLGTARPSSMTMFVAGLPTAEMLVEVMVDAARV
jgi:2-iminobutanoate/2-iminopropanoate deaminase